MEKENIQKLYRLCEEATTRKNVKLNDKTQFIADLGLSSLAILNLLTQIEKTFKVTIGAYELEELYTIGDLVHLLDQKIK